MYSLMIAVSAFDGMNELGGHYFSALITAKELRKEHKVCILVVGDFLPKTLETDDIEVIFVRYQPKIFQLCSDNIKTAAKEFNPDILIAFDGKAGSILRLFSATKKLGFIQVKPGGPIPKTPLQNNPFQVHFSQKDYEFARKRIKYKNRLIAWIPNRVNDAELDYPSIEELRKELKLTDDEIVLIRISRLDRKYENSFTSAINAANILRNAGFKIRLIMIGAITHHDVAERLSLHKNQNDVLLTDIKYTKNAKRYLGIAHINIGVGRGFMEGSAVGNHMLAMAGSSELPVVVNDKNFQSLFSENFSLRASCPVNHKKRQTDLIELANTVASGQKVSQLSYVWFKKYFDSSRINELYTPILYATYKNRESVDLNVIINALVFLVKRFIRR